LNNIEKYGLCDRFINEATMYPEYSPARIIAQYRGSYRVVSGSIEIQAELSGRLRYETAELAEFPTVGDFVMIRYDKADSNAVIHHVLTRKSVFLRTAVGVSGQAQPVAANVDIIFVCMSVNQNFNLNRLERYLSVAWDSGATPVVLLTKADLCENLEETIAETQRAADFADVVALSVFDDDISEKLKPYLKDGITGAFIGSSGVGKSTLINKLLGREVLATQDIGRQDKGRHTTTGREMFLSPSGGVLIDTPGMRELGIENADLSKSFDDVEALAAQCRFNDCTHTNEPGCAVLQALKEGRLDQRRVDSYLKLKIEAGYEGLNAKEIENRKRERMFKDVGGMKNFKKYIKETSKKR